MSKPTQSNATKKIKLARSGLAIVVLLAFTTVILSAVMQRSESPKQESEIIRLGEVLDFEVVDTPELQRKGLSDRESLAKNKAMLFVFSESGQRCIWMKDMRFSIDIVWLDKSNKIVKIAENVAPETYPDTFCADDADRVLELNAGEAKGLGLTIDGKVSLD